MRGIVEPSESGRQSSHTCQAAKISQPDHNITLCRIGLCQDRKVNLSGSINISTLWTCPGLSTFFLCQPARPCQHLSFVNLSMSVNISLMSTSLSLSTFLLHQPARVYQHFSLSTCPGLSIFQISFNVRVNIWNWSTCPWSVCISPLSTCPGLLSFLHCWPARVFCYLFFFNLSGSVINGAVSLSSFKLGRIPVPAARSGIVHIS